MVTDTTLSQALTDNILHVVEPVTRFDRTNLQFTDVLVTNIIGTGTWRQEVTFDRNTQTHAGRLPSAIRNEGSAEGARSALVAVQESCECELPDRLHAWMDHHAQDCTVLKTGDVFDGPFVRGFEHNCASCKGAGRVTCHGCGGRGNVQCSNCGGSTKVNCYSCGGRGRRSCSGCGGRGQWHEQKSRQAFNHSNNSYYTEYYTEYRRCGSCGGSGQQNCNNCSGSGRVHCMTCNQGRVTCRTCGGQGQLTCSDCAGSGRQHALSTLSCKVSSTFHGQVKDDRDEVRSQISGLTMAALHELAPLDFTRAETGRAHIQREYAFQMATVSVRAGLGEAARTLIGYGHGAKVFDMKGLVSVLLMGDLEELERSLKKKEGSRPLDKSLDLAFLSEAHIAIAKHPHDPKHELHGSLEAMAITGEHAARFTKAVRAAVQRLLRRRLFKGWLIVVLLPALVLLALTKWDLQLRWVLGIPLGILIVSGLAWRWLVERPAVNGLGKRYAHVGVKGMREIAKATRSTRHWKRWGPLAAVALLVGAGYITSAHVRLDHAVRNIIYGWVPELRPAPPSPPRPTLSLDYRFALEWIAFNQDSPAIRTYFEPFVVKGDTLLMPDGRLPDCSLQHQPGMTREWCAMVRSHWSPTLMVPIVLGSTERLRSLPNFEKKYRVKCFVILGVGGTPEAPQHLFVVPLHRKSPEELDGTALARFEVPVTGRSTRFNRNNGRIGV